MDVCEERAHRPVRNPGFRWGTLEVVAVGVPPLSCWIERPPAPHRVKLEKDFYLGEFPVTNGMYRQFVQDRGHEEPSGLLLNIETSMRAGRSIPRMTHAAR